MPFKRAHTRTVVHSTTIKKACVFGSGAFGTAMATVFARQPNQPLVHVHHLHQNEADIINIKHENIFFLNGHSLAENIVFTADIAEAINGADIIAFVVPTQFIRSFLKKNFNIIDPWLKAHPNVPLVVGSKGIEETSLMFPTQIICEVMKLDRKRVAVIAGPSFALEIADFCFTAVTVASVNINNARLIQSIMSSPDGSFRCYASTDIVGCEVASAVKNVVAIAAGAISGMGQRLNCRAALICRGFVELVNLVDKMGGYGYALQGLAGIGDMLMTCGSERSRNFTVGVRLGRGETPEAIMSNRRAVAEGVVTSRALKKLSDKIGCKMPICDAVYKVLFEKANVKEMFMKLISAHLEDEIHHIGLGESTAMGIKYREKAADYVKKHQPKL